MSHGSFPLLLLSGTLAVGGCAALSYFALSMESGPLERLFRVGANLDPEMAGTDRGRALPGFEDEEDPLAD